HDNDDRLAAVKADAQDLFLVAGQVQVGLVAAGELVALVAFLAFQAGVKAQAADDDVALGADALDLADQLAFLRQTVELVGVEVAAFGVADLAVVAQVLVQAVQHGEVAAGGTFIVADQRLAAVGGGADHGDGLELGFIQRQD